MFVSIEKPSSLYNTNNPDWPAPSAKQLGGAPEGTTVIAEGHFMRELYNEKRRRNSCSLVDLPSYRSWETKSDTGKLEVA